MNARSLLTCGCVVLVLGALAAGGGALYTWRSLEGDTWAEKLESAIEIMQPLDTELVARERLEGGGERLRVTFTPHEHWEITELEVSGQLGAPSGDGTVWRVLELVQAPPRAPGAAASEAVFELRTPVEGEPPTQLRLRVEVRAEKDKLFGNANVDLTVTNTLTLPPLTDPHAAEPR